MSSGWVTVHEHTIKGGRANKEIVSCKTRGNVPLSLFKEWVCDLM